jgi:hypothetical protein
MNEEAHLSCNFPGAIRMMCTLHCFLETSKDVPDHMLENNDANHDFLEKSLLKQTVQKKITDCFKG